MFAGFNLSIGKSFFDSEPKSYEDYQAIGVNHLSSQKAVYERTVEEYIVNKIVDGSKVQEDWFPEISADIFLSHAHADKELANALAGWLNDTFRLECFVDSNIWGYAGSLLESLNIKYSDKRSNPTGGNLYNHESCNKVSQHVNIMLNIALQKMVDKVETVFLLNTSNSIKISEDDKTVNKTYSPWIYSELVCSEIVNKKPLHYYRYNTELYHSFNESQKFSALDESMTISYNAPIKHLIEIDETILVKWSKDYCYNNPFALDMLYKVFFPEEVIKTQEHYKY